MHVQPLGFELDLDSYGTVEAVVLYNDETALGLSASDSSYSACTGVFPDGLTWDLTPGDLGFSYGAYDLEIGFNAAHEYDLPAAQIHWIRVSPSGGS